MMQCPQREIRSFVLENNVLRSIQEQMLDEEKLKDWMDYFKRKGKNEQKKYTKKLEEVNDEIEKILEIRKRILERYAKQEISRETYSEKGKELDKLVEDLRLRKQDLLNNIPLLNKEDLIEDCIKKFCLDAKLRFTKANDFDTQRQFILDYLDKIVIYNEKFELHGSVDIKDSSISEELTKIKFCIEDKMPRSERKSEQGKKTFNRRITLLNYRNIMEDQNKQD